MKGIHTSKRPEQPKRLERIPPLAAEKWQLDPLVTTTSQPKKRFIEEQSAELPVWLEWVRYLGSLLSPAWFIALLTVLIWILLGDPQTIEALQSIQRDEELKSGSLWAVGVYAFTAGYFAMAVMSVAYPGNRPPEAVAFDGEEARTAGRWWIIAIVVIITAAVPVRLIWIGYGNGMTSLANDGWIVLAVIVAVIVLAKLPAELFEDTVHVGHRIKSDRSLMDRSKPAVDIARGFIPNLKEVFQTVRLLLSPFDARTTGARNPRMRKTIFGFAIVIFLGSLLMLADFVANPVVSPQKVGMLAVALWAAASWIAFSSIFMVYLPLRFGLPSILAFVAVGGLAFIFSFWNNNHTPCLDCAELTNERPAFETFAKGWIGSRADLFAASRQAGRKTPVYVVAAAGGGIRAGYWTAAALSAFEKQVPGFSCHVLAISGVSGGSLGAAAFAAALADHEDYTCAPAAAETEVAPFDPTDTTRTMLSKDYLSPLLAGMLFADGVQRLNPLPFDDYKLPDRARAQERAWEAGWREAAKSDRFADGFMALWPGEKPGAGVVPPLFLNGTIVETGHPITVAPFGIAQDQAFSDTFDLLKEWPMDLPLSTAVDMSTRFPYVSPAATIELETRQFRVVDGGYFENSGAHVAQQIARAFLGAIGEEEAEKIQIVPILIINDLGRNADGKLTPEDLLQRPPLGAPERESWAAAELTSPVVAALSTRSARGLNAEQELVRRFEPDCTIVAAATGGDVALGWLLSKDSTDLLDNAAAALFDDDGNNVAALLRLSSGGTGVGSVQHCEGPVPFLESNDGQE